MTSIGRGRGWGKSPSDTSGGLRRPGQPLQAPKQSSNVDETDEWIQKISELNINDSSGAQSMQSPLTTELQNSPTDESLKRLDNAINKALEDRNFAVKFVLAFNNPHDFKSDLLRLLQPHFEDREKMVKDDLPRFLNLVFVLSEIFQRVRTRFGTLRALEPPLIVCYEMLLNLAGEEEIELAATKIALNGRLLHLKSVKGLPELIILAREILATRNLSSRSRAMLMLIIDLYNQEFMPLSGELQKFYADHLGQETLLEMQSNSNKNIWIEIDTHYKIDSECDDMKNENSSAGILMQVPQNQKSQNHNNPKKGSPKNFSSQNSNSGKSNNSYPRAIRGSGAVNRNKDHRGDKKFGERKDKNDCGQWTNWNDGGANKNWNHDDRFSKDY